MNEYIDAYSDETFYYLLGLKNHRGRRGHGENQQLSVRSVSWYEKLGFGCFFNERQFMADSVVNFL